MVWLDAYGFYSTVFVIFVQLFGMKDLHKMTGRCFLNQTLELAIPMMSRKMVKQFVKQRL